MWLGSASKRLTVNITKLSGRPNKESERDNVEYTISQEIPDRQEQKSTSVGSRVGVVPWKHWSGII